MACVRAVTPKPRAKPRLPRSGGRHGRHCQSRRCENPLSELLAKVEADEEFVIARGNVPVARLVPLDEQARRALIGEMLAERDYRARKTVTTDEILAWRREGHKY